MKVREDLNIKKDLFDTVYVDKQNEIIEQVRFYIGAHCDDMIIIYPDGSMSTYNKFRGMSKPQFDEIIRVRSIIMQEATK